MLGVAVEQELAVRRRSVMAGGRAGHRRRGEPVGSDRRDTCAPPQPHPAWPRAAAGPGPPPRRRGRPRPYMRAAGSAVTVEGGVEVLHPARPAPLGRHVEEGELLERDAQVHDFREESPEPCSARPHDCVGLQPVGAGPDGHPVRSGLPGDEPRARLARAAHQGADSESAARNTPPSGSYSTNARSSTARAGNRRCAPPDRAVRRALRRRVEPARRPPSSRPHAARTTRGRSPPARRGARATARAHAGRSACRTRPARAGFGSGGSRHPTRPADDRLEALDQRDVPLVARQPVGERGAEDAGAYDDRGGLAEGTVAAACEATLDGPCSQHRSTGSSPSSPACPASASAPRSGSRSTSSAPPRRRRWGSPTRSGRSRRPWPL